MTKPLKILIVEDAEDDMLMLLRELRKAGYEPVHERVETAEELKSALDRRPWDIVVSDYQMPKFDGLAALAIVNEQELEVPFIIVSGNIGEDIAVQAMRAGAHDYIIKGNLARFIPAVERELRDAEVRRERKSAEDQLRQSRQKLLETLENISEGFFTIDHEWRFSYANNEAARLWRKPLVDLIGESFWEAAPKERGTIFEELLRKAMGDHAVAVFDAFSPTLGIWLEMRAYPGPDGLAVYFHDITDRKDTERRIRVTNALLHLFAQKASRKTYLDTACGLIREWSGCRHVGVRIANRSKHIPFESCEGYDAVFLKRENELSLLEDHCVCTRVVAGNPEKPDLCSMTPSGSFFSNDTARFVEDLRGDDRARYRGVCMGQKYKSLAVIPIRYQESPLGALHLADEREGMLPVQNVEFLEQLGIIIGEAIFRFGIEHELRKNLDDLQKTTELLERVFSTTHLLIAYMDREFNFVRVNRAYARDDGHEPEFYAGRNYFQLCADDEMQEIFQNSVDTGDPYFAFEQSFQRTGRKDRAPGYWDWSIVPVKEADGRVTGLVFTLLDVTDRKNAEKDQARLASAVEATADGIVITDPVTGVIQYVNPAFEQITGYARQEALGRTLHLLDSGRHDHELYGQIETALARDGVWRGRLINKKKDGSFYFEDCTFSPVRDETGSVISYISVKRDVTERLRLESIAESVNTMDNIGYVFSGVRHEIGNPINTAKMSLSVLQHKLEGASKDVVRDYVGRALGEIGRVEQLLKNLKNYNLYETPERENLDMAVFMEKFFQLIVEDFAKKGIAITHQVREEGRWAVADPRALQQVLLNLITNAADALADREEPAISVTVERKYGRVLLQIADNGCGMTEKQLADLFKPFYTSKAHGTGLGLVIVKKMLTRMDCEIEVTSLPDKGTTVSILLPEVDNAAPHA